MVAQTEQMLQHWSARQTWDISDEMMSLTRRLACKTLLGFDFLDETEAFGKLILQWMSFFTSPAVMLPLLDLPETPYRRCLEASSRLERTVREMIAHKRTAGAGGADALSLLLHAQGEQGDGLTEDELIGHVTLLFLAGQLTSSSTLTWTLFLLAQHPPIMADLLDELTGKLHGDAPTPQQLQDLPLLDHVLKESMRLLPVIPMSARITTQAVEMGSYLIAEGVSPYHTHHQADLYPQPERFLPSRWQQIHPSPYEYVPFGAGKRMCIGSTFAIFEMKIILATIVQRYRLQVAPGTRVDHLITGRLTLVPKNGLPMRICPQDRHWEYEQVRGTIRDLVELES